MLGRFKDIDKASGRFMIEQVWHLFGSHAGFVAK